MNEETAPFHVDCIAESREQKESMLRDFFMNDIFEEVDGVPRNRNKFLYLFGDENTGKLQILKQIAEEVFGSQWESKLYLRIDEGQKFPYKLHAHKVESSRKVVFVTKSRVTWNKWKDLYPALKTYQFMGAEINQSNDGIVQIRYTEYVLKRMRRQQKFKEDIKLLFQNENTHNTLLMKVLERMREDFQDQHNEMLTCEHV